MDVETLQAARGRVIVIEGIDQSGKRTQARLLAKELAQRDCRASVWNFPNYVTPVGKQLRAYLAGRIRLDYHAVHLLYAANKWEKASELAGEISRGRSVIVNRYSPSNLAYGAAHGLPLDWLESLEKGLPKPDIVFVLDIAPQTSFRRKKRKRDVHEGDLKYLRKVRNAYIRLAGNYGWRVIDAERDPGIIRRELWKVVARVMRIKLAPQSNDGSLHQRW